MCNQSRCLSFFAAAAACVLMHCAPSTNLDDSIQRLEQSSRFAAPLDGVNLGLFLTDPSGQAVCPTANQVRWHVDAAGRLGNTIRIYGLGVCRQGDLALAAARELAIPIHLGLWLGPDDRANQDEINLLIALVHKYGVKAISGVSVGNETLLRGDLNEGQLLSYLSQVRGALGAMGYSLPVSTAEPANLWTPELANAVDFLFPNIHPYFGGVPSDKARDEVIGWVNQLQQLAPGKTLIISETGWPTAGPANEAAQPSVAHLSGFVKDFVCSARNMGLHYFFFEALDEPWRGQNAAVEAHWGLLDAQGQPKLGEAWPPLCP